MKEDVPAAGIWAQERRSGMKQLKVKERRLIRIVTKGLHTDAARTAQSNE
jgi:hypothetical protein